MHPNRLSPPYQLFILTLSLFAIGLLALQTTQQMTPETSTILAYADYALCALFFLDFLICLYHAENRLHYFRTWGWLDLLSSIPMLEVARLGRAARALRIIRVLRGIRATRVLSQLILQRRSESTMLAATLVALLLIVVSSIATQNVENDPASNIRTAGDAEDAEWWACTTITTVGYGNKFPLTCEGSSYPADCAVCLP